MLEPAELRKLQGDPEKSIRYAFINMRKCIINHMVIIKINLYENYLPLSFLTRAEDVMQDDANE